jgi:cbb3-type cytochrome oxidase subunit 3
VCVGAFAGNYKDMIINIIDSASHIILILIIIVFIGFVIWFYRDRIKPKKK